MKRSGRNFYFHTYVNYVNSSYVDHEQHVSKIYKAVIQNGHSTLNINSSLGWLVGLSVKHLYKSYTQKPNTADKTMYTYGKLVYF